MLCVALILYKNFKVENNLLYKIKNFFFALLQIVFFFRCDNIENVKVFVTISAMSKIAFIIFNIVLFEFFY